MEKIEALAKFLGVDANKIKESVNNDGISEIKNGERYMVLTDDEAEEEFYNYESDLIEEFGLDAFTDWARDYIIENCLAVDWFEDYFREDYESYANNIETESASSDEYANRLEEEMAEAECADVEEFIDYLVDSISDDFVEEFKFNFGEKMLTEVIMNNNLLDMDAVVDYIKETDGNGRGILATYDGVENEEGEYYIYRTN